MELHLRFASKNPTNHTDGKTRWGTRPGFSVMLSIRNSNVCFGTIVVHRIPITKNEKLCDLEGLQKQYDHGMPNTCRINAEKNITYLSWLRRAKEGS
jgi:hypothetical protein